ncbi:AAR027Wp [Eremothecium gossypii ATCC 10895]|uniref:Small ribosomal subunit protein uS5m n=1 Tax=Eremothecium gossypii (strain ATCC 10895 / CBS 109.51 / FGSC 9923 / NRRL Y-1056) TaxID=284811 RepID=Q75EQ2_EREGS|nr:mitochondrial 37S ribosomal protein MRPS5 [Eremothecium gossypii ATCC 10895]AAS50392.2 AAR027Wp [Eremothecium gossypii ATCC 10895]AEY94678.1 FAAR027Wp [Eremothecium gossypii FDAG1]
MLFLRRALSCAVPRRMAQDAMRPSTGTKDAYKSMLAQYYPQELLKSIELGEQAIPDDAEYRLSSNVEFAPPYLDDFSKLDPFWDYKPGLPHQHADGPLTAFRPDQQHQPLPERLEVPRGAALLTTGGSNMAAIARGIARQTGLDAEYITRKLVMRPLVVKRVSNQTAKGKIASFYSLVVVGDRNGMVGLGEGKSREDVSESIKKAHWNAIKNLKHIPRYENRTIFGDIDFRFHGVKLHLRSAKPGFGLRVNHVIYEICECAGIKDLSGKVYKSRNEMNIAKGTLEALTKSQKTLEEIAYSRGKKLVDVRKVYYSSD